MGSQMVLKAGTQEGVAAEATDSCRGRQLWGWQGSEGLQGWGRDPTVRCHTPPGHLGPHGKSTRHPEQRSAGPPETGAELTPWQCLVAKHWAVAHGHKDRPGQVARVPSPASTWLGPAASLPPRSEVRRVQRWPRHACSVGWAGLGGSVSVGARGTPVRMEPWPAGSSHAAPPGQNEPLSCDSTVATSLRSLVQ